MWIAPCLLPSPEAPHAAAHGPGSSTRLPTEALQALPAMALYVRFSDGAVAHNDRLMGWLSESGGAAGPLPVHAVLEKLGCNGAARFLAAALTGARQRSVGHVKRPGGLARIVIHSVPDTCTDGPVGTFLVAHSAFEGTHALLDSEGNR